MALKHVLLIGALAAGLAACKPQAPQVAAQAEVKGPPPAPAPCACDQGKAGVQAAAPAMAAPPAVKAPPRAVALAGGPTHRRQAAVAHRQVRRDAARHSRSGAYARRETGPELYGAPDRAYAARGGYARYASGREEGRYESSRQYQSGGYSAEGYSQETYAEGGYHDGGYAGPPPGYGGGQAYGYSTARAYTVSQSSRYDVRRSRAQTRVRCP